jgi:hypothetical protein
VPNIIVEPSGGKMVIFDTCMTIQYNSTILRPGMRPLGRVVHPTGRTALHLVLDAELWKALGLGKTLTLSKSDLD